MLDIVAKFEKILYGVLIIMLMVVLVFATVQLAWTLFTSLTNPSSPGLLENYELVNVLGAFLLVLIGIELMDTMMEYFRENAIHVEIVVLLAIIAIARKVILLDPATTTGIEMIGIGIVILGLAGAYYLIRKAGFTIGKGGLQQKEQG
jgi:uncharacterized membrane protein (DUF373 family)